MTVVERAIVLWRKRVAASNAILRDVSFYGASEEGAPKEKWPRSVIEVRQLGPTRANVPFSVIETVEVSLKAGTAGADIDAALASSDDYPNAFEKIVNELSEVFDNVGDPGNAFARLYSSFNASATTKTPGELRRAVINWTVYASWETAA